MKIDPGMHIGLHLVFFGKTGVTYSACCCLAGDDDVVVLAIVARFAFGSYVLVQSSSLCLSRMKAQPGTSAVNTGLCAYRAVN
jgi:hypothetical protein